MSARQFGDQLLTRLLTYTLEAVPGAVGVGLSIATGDEEAAVPHSAAAVGVATELDRAQWSHSTGPLWAAFRSGRMMVLPDLERDRPANVEEALEISFESGPPAEPLTDRADSLAGSHLLGLDGAEDEIRRVADTVVGAVFSSGEWGGELPVIVSVYLDRPPDSSTLQEIDRHEPVLTQSLAVVEYCAGEELLAAQMVQMNQYRRVIEQAKGLIMGAVGTGSAEAFETLSRASQHFNVRLRSLAVALVEHVGGGPAEHPDDPNLVVHPTAVDRKVAARVWAALTASSYLTGGGRTADADGPGAARR